MRPASLLRHLSAPVILISMFLPWASAQEPTHTRSHLIEDALRQDPSRAGVNTHSYEFGPLLDTPAPKGYRPVYISHYGRHGSRSDWGRDGYKAVVEILGRASEEGVLSSGGDSLLRECTAIYEGHDGMDGRLTARGMEEHRMLSRRMYRRYGEVFRRGSRKVRCISSTVPRCLLSMTAFTDALTESRKELDISWDTGEKFMEYMTNGCPDSLSKVAVKMLQPLRRDFDESAWEYTARRIFSDPVRGGEIVGDHQAFTGMLLHTARNADAFDIHPGTLRFLSPDVIYGFYEGNAMSLYLMQCNSKELGRERTALCRPLADDIVQKADEALSRGDVCADLRFGHDYPILSLFGFLGLEGAGDCLSLEEARTGWFATLYVPFAANLQMVFYRSRRSPEVLVKFLVNEKETLISGLAPWSGPYYAWDDVKAYLGERFR